MSPRREVNNVLDSDIIGSYSGYFRTKALGSGMEPFIPKIMGHIVRLLFFYNNIFPLNYEQMLIYH